MSVDDRVLCSDCVSRVADRCKVARESVLLGVWSDFPYWRDDPRRCVLFEARAGAVDQRSGRDRYPTMWAEYETTQAERTRVRRETNQRGIARAKAAVAAQEVPVP